MSSSISLSGVFLLSSAFGAKKEPLRLLHLS